MNKINNLNDFKKITSNITSFSHAYLFNVNSLSVSFDYVKEFAKMIICNNGYRDNCDRECDICYQIDNNEYDDLYIVNPETIGINTIEIEKLLHYMETKSLRENGKRVYIIYGIERLSRDVSNKILKFLEEPNENIYALLLTEKIDQILPTIISRCQVINLSFNIDSVDNEILDVAKKFLVRIIKNGNSTIAYTNEYFSDLWQDRIKIDEFFVCLEKIISEHIKYRYKENFDKIYLLSELSDIDINNVLNILDITNRLKILIKKNINLNLLVDRYIIEISKELSLCRG